MTDLLAVTLGNTSAAAATADADGVLRDVARAPLAQLEAILTPRLEAADGPVVVGSVNPPALVRLREAAEAAGCDGPFVAGEDFPIPVRTDVDEPDRVGTDRLLAALAAYRRAGRACIVIDVGTAVTVDAVDDAGTFLGGAIAPGRELMAQALAEGTAQLPYVTPCHAESILGKNTSDAIRTGIYHTFLGGTTMMLAAALSEVGEHAAVFLTGGDLATIKSDADDLLSQCDTQEDELKQRGWPVPELVLEGLVLAWREQQEP
ncbi:MAG: type III pantothenate kinase [Phycisphaerae bacterium]